MGKNSKKSEQGVSNDDLPLADNLCESGNVDFLTKLRRIFGHNNLCRC